ncbi:hypothetical protein ACSNOB_31985, partial [Micromonospora sp. URMC 106]
MFNDPGPPTIPPRGWHRPRDATGRQVTSGINQTPRTRQMVSSRAGVVPSELWGEHDAASALS